ncbi:Uncharacterised protein [Legionella spiritensis]|nr:Uncharacterised protein [Legionella spiritensis]
MIQTIEKVLKTTQNLPKEIEEKIKYSNIKELRGIVAGSIPAASTNI